MSTELSHPVLAERVGTAGLEVVVTADRAACEALARRMQVPAVHSLRCRFRLSRLTSDTILAEGHLQASVTQTCVVSAEDFTAQIDEDFRVRFVPEGEETDDLDPDDDDEIGYAGASLDLGEAAAEQLALALDPYPRAPGAELPEVEVDGDDSPFAMLRQRQH